MTILTEFPNCPSHSRTLSEKFELFEDPFQTSLIIHNQLTEDDRNNYFHFLMRGDALQTFEKPNPKEFGWNSSSFPKEVCKTPVDGNSKTQIPKTRLQSSKSKVSRFPWRTSKTGQRRIRKSCPCHHCTIHLCQNATRPEKINKSGPSGE